MKADTYTLVGVPVIRGTNISERRAWKGEWVFISDEFANSMPRCVVRAGALVFPHRGSIGEVAIVPVDEHERYFLSTSLMKIEIDPAKANPNFVYFFFRSPDGRSEILRYASQVGTPGIGQPLESLRRFKLPLPPLGVQDAIAAILGALDNKIDLNSRMNETLEAMARAIFKDWFIDFGPTRAKIECRAPYLAPEIWKLFPDRLDDEGKPDGWHPEPLLKHAHLLSGGTPKTADAAYWGGPISWASAKDVSQCGALFLLDTERSITGLGLTESSTRMIPMLSTVVVARGATTGRFCMLGREMAMNQTCYALATRGNRPFWVNCVFASLVESIVHGAHGSVFDTITTRTIQTAMTVIPSEAVLDLFEGSVGPLFMRALGNHEESRSLAQIRDLLLPKLMSGEIRVKDAEKR